MDIFLSVFDDVPDPRAENARHDLGELLVIAFISVLCGATICAEVAAAPLVGRKSVFSAAS